MSYVLDEGLALFAGLNAIPKRSFLTEYSCRIAPTCYPRLMRHWFDRVSRLGLRWGTSFDLDFHTIPFHGEDALVEKHYISKRSRSQKGMLAFLAQDAETHVFCYANAELRKDQRDDEILRFVDFWKRRTDNLPEELIFDSKLTTYAKLSELSRMGIRFITLRRRSKNLLAEIARTPMSAWRRIELESVSRAYRTPRVLDQRIKLKDYHGPLRQLTITELGHEDPTLLLTNQLKRSASHLIGRYAQRMLIENNIEDGIDFFHMDALSSAVAIKVNCDLQLTLMASSLYRLLAVRVANGYETVKSRHLFQDLIDATADITMNEGQIVVKFQKRACNPLLIAARFDQTDVVIPWLGGSASGWFSDSLILAHQAERGVKSKTNTWMKNASRSNWSFRERTLPPWTSGQRSDASHSKVGVMAILAVVRGGECTGRDLLAPDDPACLLRVCLEKTLRSVKCRSTAALHAASES